MGRVGDWDADDMAGTQHVVEGERWIDGILLKDGKRWQRREIEVLNGMRPWGDVLEMDVKEAKIRIEPFEWKTSKTRGAQSLP